MVSYDTYDNVLNCTQQRSRAIAPRSILYDELTGYYKMAEAGNAMSNEFFFMGFEMLLPATYLGTYPNTLFDGGHTGIAYYNGSFTTAFVPPNSKNYKISYWYKETGKWKYSGELSYTQGMVLPAYQGLDDIRIYPENSRIISYTYSSVGGKTSEISHDGKTTYYEYDNMDRNTITRDDDGNIIKLTEYHDNVSNATGPMWVETRTTRCVKDALDEYTGVEEEEQKDINPNSASYGSTRWVSLGITGKCPVPFVYVSIIYENYQNFGTYTTADILVRFYADETQTVAMDVTELPINFEWESSCNTGVSESSLTCYGKFTYLVQNAVIQYQDQIYENGMPTGVYQDCFVDYRLRPGAGYVIW
jgi:hypothetical protein